MDNNYYILLNGDKIAVTRDVYYVYMEHFAPKFSGYKTSKGAVQFPYKSFGAEQLALIAEIAAWCGRAGVSG